jgi:hypothetical protein
MRRRGERVLDHRRDLIVINATGPTRARLIKKAVDPILQEPAPPFADRVFVHAKLYTDSFAGKPIGAAQDDTAALR